MFVSLVNISFQRNNNYIIIIVNIIIVSVVMQEVDFV